MAQYRAGTGATHSVTANNSYARGIDQAGRISSYPLGNALVGGVQRKLVYDNASGITDFKPSGAANASVLDQTFGYDGQGRLISAKNGSTSLGYQYDDNGNRTVLQIGGNSYSNTIAPNSNRLMTTNGPVPAKNNIYDKAGNLLSDGNITFTYDETNRLQRADRGSVVATYQYNSLGQRVLNQTTPAAAGREKIFYAYDEAGHVIGEYDGQGTAITETVFLGDTPVAVIKPNPATPNKPAVFYIYADHLNTPRVITSAQDNKIVWRWTELGPLGEKLPEENPSGLGVFVYNLRFAGQMYDAESGLHQNYFRDFDPIGLMGGHQ